MKTKYLSLVIAFIALLNFSTAYAQGGNPHFIGATCFNEDTGIISGKVAGLGNNVSGISITVAGQYGCQNPGGNLPPAWQNFSLTNIPITATGNPGQYTFSVNVGSLSTRCHSNWKLIFQNLSASIVKGNRTLATSPVSFNCP